MSRRGCAHRGCDATPKNAAGFLCAPHWFALPSDLRQRIWDAHRARNLKTSLQLVSEALQFLREKSTPEVTRG